MSGSTAFSSPDTVSILSQLSPAPASLMERIEKPGLPPDRLVAALSASLGTTGDDGPPAALSPSPSTSHSTYADGMASEAVGTAAAATAATAQARSQEHLPVPLPRMVWREETDGDVEPAISPVLAGGLVGLGAGLVVTLGLYIASGGSNSVFWPSATTPVVQASALPGPAAAGAQPAAGVIRTIGVATTEERAEARDDGRQALKLAERLIAQGDIAGAREILARVAADGMPHALLALAETYDPNVLAAWGVRSAEADTERARHLYTSALVAGVEQARRRLETLD
jgi:hypothetical protein